MAPERGGADSHSTGVLILKTGFGFVTIKAAADGDVRSAGLVS